VVAAPEAAVVWLAAGVAVASPQAASKILNIKMNPMTRELLFCFGTGIFALLLTINWLSVAWTGI
jgi:hypothetical protein